MQTVERAPAISAETTTAVIKASTAAGYDIVRRPRTTPPAPRGTVRRATSGHRYLTDEAGDGSRYRRRGE